VWKNCRPSCRCSANCHVPVRRRADGVSAPRSH
jgi:ferredoxin